MLRNPQENCAARGEVLRGGIPMHKVPLAEQEQHLR